MWFMSNKKTFCIPLPFSPVLIAPRQAPKARNCFCSDEYCCCKHKQPAGKSEKANLWSGTDPFESNLFLLLLDFGNDSFSFFYRRPGAFVPAQLSDWYMWALMGLSVMERIHLKGDEKVFADVPLEKWKVRIIRMMAIDSFIPGSVTVRRSSMTSFQFPGYHLKENLFHC